MPTHLLAGWMVANARELDRRDRALVTLAGVAPDLDGFGYPVQALTRHADHPLLWYRDYHHVLGHNLVFAAIVASACAALAHRRPAAAALAFLSFHLHLLCDVIGSRGPDGDQWPVPYLWPFVRDLAWTWSGQWRLDAWPNFAITIALIAATLLLAARRGYSPVGILSERADRAFVQAVRRRLPVRAAES